MKYSGPNEHWYYSNKLLRKNEADYKGCMFSMITILIIIILCLLFYSCKSIQYVPVETVTHDTIKTHEIVYVADTTKESTTLKDSTWTLIHEADSAELLQLGIKLNGVTKAYVIERNKVRELEKKLSSATEKVITKDSIVYKEKNIQVPYPVEKQLSRWEKIKMEAGGFAIAICFVVIIFLFILLGIYIRKRR